MWDPAKFYENLENSIFKIMLTCGTLLNCMTTWNIIFLKIILTCGIKLVYDDFAKLMAS
jgi:hypothetical protein